METKVPFLSTPARRLVAAGVPVLLFAALSYHLLDRPLAAAVRGIEPEIRDVFQVITLLGDSTAYIVFFSLVTLYGAFVLRDGRLWRGSLWALASVVTGGLAADAVKALVGRWRPKALFEGGYYGLEPFRTDYLGTSFPSGHAATVFALAYVLAELFPSYRAFWWAAAVVVGLSRLVVGAHFLGDVVTGAYVCVLCAFLLRKTVLFGQRRDKEGDP
ncbi:MAG TPA: phosphatase PAP2 family protein [Syntrophales bacterium]|nr:phosphatase PAP2 family protein [Syntrophales bacterium]HOM07649.1 phosphatase PAP2 family protein [Syntrophales bacterium]HOO00314.1 phosphatase PAP2 family protein [Syntrophales bacterium]HPC01210.1 phosphatase PAP2 family protein [Syntrophales bacterium]HPQ07209.1 phosphatase PAP2 family protein [Syntrophales bacterium]